MPGVYVLKCFNRKTHLKYIDVYLDIIIIIIKTFYTGTICTFYRP